MELDYSIPEKVKIGMVDYVDDMLKELPAKFDGTSPTPAGNYLFDINPECEKLNDSDKEFFH